MTLKTIISGNYHLVVSGRSGDPYFENLNFGDHTNDFLMFISNLCLKKDAIIFDVGANIGATLAVLAVASPKGQVFAFEPESETYKHLLKTIKANKFTNCHTYELALGATSGEIAFLANDISGSASHLAVSGTSLGGHNARVKIKMLDQFVIEHNLARLDLIKIDVEGFELDVLEGAKNTLAKLRPNVFLEFNSFTLIAYGNKNPRFVLEYLKSLFPHVYRYENGALHEITDENSILGFIHDNLLKRSCVDDLYCTFDDIQTT